MTAVLFSFSLVFASPGRLTIPLLRRPPKVDGIVEVDEWARASAITGFLRLGEEAISHLPTVAFLGYDEKALYVAFRCFSPLPPIARRRRRDGEVWRDDSVEVFLDPGRTLSRHFQFVGSATGSVWDSIGKDPSWDAEWEFKARTIERADEMPLLVLDGQPLGPSRLLRKFPPSSPLDASVFERGWEAEFRIPFSSLKVRPPREGEIWGLNLARNARAGGEEHSCLAPVARSFHETEKFWEAAFGGVDDFVRLLFLGLPYRGWLTICFEGPKGARLEAEIGRGGTRRRGWVETKGLLHFDLPERGEHSLALRAIGPKGELLAMAAKVSREPDIPVRFTKRFLLKGGVELEADLRPFEGAVRRLTVELTNGKGKVVRRFELEISPDRLSARGFLRTADVRAGDYTLRFVALDKAGKRLAEESYTLAVPPRPKWLGSRAGISDEVLWPWTPVEVSGRTAKVWGRSYRLGPSGLPESIVSRDRQLLLRPVALRLRIEGREAKFEGDIKLVEHKPSKCVYRSEGNWGELGWRCTTAIEFDGMMRFDLELLPRGRAKVDEFSLLVPLRREHAKYLHYWPWAWGRVCTNSFALKGPWHYAFRPIIFLSDEERGLCWFAETNEPFDLEKPERTMEVSPQGEEVLLKVNIFDHPVELSEPWRWTFGLQATPVKPVPVAWWLKDRIVHWGRYGMESSPVPKPTGTLVYPAEGNVNPMHGTLEMWVRPEFDPWDPKIDKVPLGRRGAFNQSLLTLRLANRNLVGFYWNADDHGMRFYTCIGGKYPIIAGAKAPTMKKGKWSHVALVWGDEIRIYVDGKLTLRRKWKGLFGKTVNLKDAEIVLGGGRCEFVVDEIRISDVERTSFDLTKPLERDDHTLLLDRLDERFVPDGTARTRPEVGRGGVPSWGTAFVKGKFGRALRLFREAPPGWEGMTYLDAVKAIGAKTIVFHEHWTEIQNYYDTLKNEERLKSLVKACHERGLRLAVYFGYEISDIAPEYEHYARECLAWKPGMWFYTRQPPQRAYRVCYRSPWADFLAWGIEHALKKYDLDGVYLDGTAAPFACDNELHGCGYVGKDGRRHPTYPIFAVRELMKRIYTICYRHRGKEVFVNVHNSTGLYIPTLAFATSYWDGEQFAPLRHGQFKPLEIVPLDAFRAEFMGKNAGIPADFLVYPGRPWLYEEALALALIHDVLPRPPGGPASREAWLASRIWKAFSEFGAEEAEWIPYWRSEEFVEAEPEKVYVSLYLRRGKGALAVVSNLGEREAKVRLTFRPKRLGLPRISQVRNIFTGEELRVRREAVALSLRPVRMCVLWLR